MKTTASLTKPALTVLNDLSDMTGVNQQRIIECLIVDEWIRVANGGACDYSVRQFPDQFSTPAAGKEAK